MKFRGQLPAVLPTTTTSTTTTTTSTTTTTPVPSTTTPPTTTTTSTTTTRAPLLTCPQGQQQLIRCTDGVTFACQCDGIEQCPDGGDEASLICGNTDVTRCASRCDSLFFVLRFCFIFFIFRYYYFLSPVVYRYFFSLIGLFFPRYFYIYIFHGFFSSLYIFLVTLFIFFQLLLL